MNAGNTAAYFDSGCWPGPYTLKYRSDTVDRPFTRVHTRQNCSAASLLTAYGDWGSVGMSSRLTTSPTSPYTLELEAYTTRRTPDSSEATSTFMVPATLHCSTSTGSSMDRGTLRTAPWWNTTSTPAHAART